METGNSSTRYRNKHQRPNGALMCAWIQVFERQLHHRTGSAVYHCSNRNADSHQNKENTENRIEACNDLINRKERCKEIIDQYDDCPHFYIEPFRSQQRKKSRRAYHKYDTDHNKQHQSEYAHDVLHRMA